MVSRPLMLQLEDSKSLADPVDPTSPWKWDFRNVDEDGCSGNVRWDRQENRDLLTVEEEQEEWRRLFERKRAERMREAAARTEAATRTAALLERKRVAAAQKRLSNAFSVQPRKRR